MTRRIIICALAAALLFSATAVHADPVPLGLSPITSFGDTPIGVPATQASPQQSTYWCGGEIGYLRRVLPAEIRGLEEEGRVSVMPVCEGSDYALRNAGNAGALRGLIARNPALVAALAAAAYGPTDVVGVRMTGESSAILYVQSRRY